MHLTEEERDLRTNNFDPLAYIESAFLDVDAVEPKEEASSDSASTLSTSGMDPDRLDVQIPSLGDYIPADLRPQASPSRKATVPASARAATPRPSAPKAPPVRVPAKGEVPSAPVESDEVSDEETPTKFRKTVMSAPRPRRAKSATPAEKPKLDPELQNLWSALPKNVEFLCSFYDDEVTKNYYQGEFKENRQELIRRLLDPELSLEETSRLLGVCPATVRRYTNRGWMAHYRTSGGQRRFRLSDIVKFVDVHGRFPKE